MDNSGTLIDAEWLAHRGLDVQRAHVLPVLLQEGHEEVDGQDDVLEELVGSHLDVTEGDSEAEHLLQLELDGGADLLNLGVQVVVVGDNGGELADLVQRGSQNTGDLLDQALGGEEGIVLLG